MSSKTTNAKALARPGMRAVIYDLAPGADTGADGIECTIIECTATHCVGTYDDGRRLQVGVWANVLLQDVAPDPESLHNGKAADVQQPVAPEDDDEPDGPPLAMSEERITLSVGPRHWEIIPTRAKYPPGFSLAGSVYVDGERIYVTPGTNEDDLGCMLVSMVEVGVAAATMGTR